MTLAAGSKPGPYGILAALFIAAAVPAAGDDLPSLSHACAISTTSSIGTATFRSRFIGGSFSDWRTT